MRHSQKPKVNRDWDAYSDYVPFDSITVHEKEKRPVLYDPTGKPLAHPPESIGFKKKG